MDGLITSYFESGDFYSASDSLREFCLLRAASIRRQLDGKLSTETQKQSQDDKVDASKMKMDDLL